MAPLFHTWAELADVIAVYETEGLPFRDSQIWELVEATRDARIVHLPGLGVLVLGRDLVDLVTTSYYLEFSLARSNFIAAVLGANQLRTLTPADLARIIPRRGGPQHHREFFLSLDPGPASEVLGPQPPPADVEAHVRWKMALACRMLAAQETLVAFLEHVSHRLPDGRWLMTPIKNFALMTPDDMIVLDEHDRWLSGPAPAHFVHFHGDLFRARPDVQAVVHVHDVFGRVFVQSGRSAASIWRNGATDARRSMAVYQEPDLLFDPEPRTAAIAALDGYDILHELSHGTDYVAGTLEEATVRAIHREELLRMHVLASLLGEPRLLSEATVRDLEDTGPEWATWWIFYGSRLGTPYQSTSWFPMTTKFL
jgi:ribulose-5-phosphate 4-epimerase/fuculose-1-phosphate aldolase